MYVLPKHKYSAQQFKCKIQLHNLVKNRNTIADALKKNANKRIIYNK